MIREFAEDLKDPEFVAAFIKEWNESRLDMFALSPPNENLVFSGVMRFYFQDRGQKAATKCIRVTNLQTVAHVMTTLIEKFCPDMKMLSTPNYELYEIHGTGDVRKLGPDEFPLLVQLLWHNDDREGRFVLKSADLKIQPAKFFELNQDEGQLKRRLSRREKKDLKKKRKEQLKNRSEEKLLADHVYRELPESSFTRTISNPEAVMRRRRQQKLEKRMKEFSSKGGGPQTGGILKIFAESLKPEIPYKTILASVKDNADVITKAALDKFLLSKEDPAYYCIVMAIIPHGDNASLENAKERVIRSSDCPLAIQNSWPKNRGLITFHLRRRAEGTVEAKREHEKDQSIIAPPPLPEKPKPPVESNTSNDMSMKNNVDDEYDRDNVPYFLELTPEGKEINYKPKIYYIKPQETIIGSSRNPSPGIQYLQLFSPKILASHCSIVNADGTVSIVPHGPEADVRVGGDRVYDITLLQTGDVVQFGGLHTFRFCNPLDFVNKDYDSPEGSPPVNYPQYDHQKSFTTPPVSPELIERMLNEQIGSNIDDSDDENEIETTFGVDGEVETSKMKKQNISSAYSAENLVGGESNSIRESFKKNRQSAPDLTNIQDPTVDENLLPASLTFLDHGKDAFFATVTSEVNGSAVSFKLAPTYTLYLAARHLLSPSYRPGTSPSDRSKIVATISKRIATSIQQTIQENDCLAGGLAFWMANASELLHFYRQDIDLGAITQAAQSILAQSIQESFALLVNAMEEELALALPAFLDPTDSVDILPHDLDAILNDDLLERAESMELLNWTTANVDHEFHDPRLDKQSYNGEQWITPAARIRYHGIPIMADVLYILSSAMSLLRRCRVNAALTIQLFSQLFHFINMWTFNRIVLEPDLKLCSRLWGHCLRMRLSFIEAWAERQGLELAADCHLARVVQAAHLLEATKDSAEAIADVASACFKLNSMQLRTLLENYLPEMDEPIIPQELIDSIVSVAESTADELTQTDGRDVKLEEDIQLQLPFLLPEEGYSSDIIRGVPPGLQEFLEPLCSIGVCELTFNVQSHGLWTVYQIPYNNIEDIGEHEGGMDNPVVNELPIQRVTINKGKSGLGLSICATKGAQSNFTGIYIKAVIVGGLADQDRRLEAGDQILSVNESSLIDVSQTQAAKIMGKCGPVITLEVMKGAAFYHGLSKLVEGDISLGPQQHAPPKEISEAILLHQKSDDDDSSNKLPVVPEQVSNYNHQKERSADRGMSQAVGDMPPQQYVHKKQKSNSSLHSDEDMIPPRHAVAPPPPVHRKQKSNDSLHSDEDMIPPRHVAPPPPVHRKQKSNDSLHSNENVDPSQHIVPPPRSHKKQKGNDSSKLSYSVDKVQVPSHAVEEMDVQESVVCENKDGQSNDTHHKEDFRIDSGEVEMIPPSFQSVTAAIEPVEENKVILVVEAVEEEHSLQYNDSDYDSDGNLMTKEEKEKLARQRQRQKEYEERLAKWEEQRKRQEEEKKEKCQVEAEEKRHREEEERRHREEEERRHREEEEKCHREEQLKRERIEEQEKQQYQEVMQKQIATAAKEAERLQLAEEARRKQELQQLEKEKRQDEKACEIENEQHYMEELKRDRLKEEAARHAEKLIEESKRKEEEESKIRAQKRGEEEEKRRMEYEAHVEKRRIEHEKMVEQQEKMEAEKDQQCIEEEEKEHLQRAAPRSSVNEKREQFNAEMSSLDEALREAERIAAEMDMFMMEEEQKIEDDLKEKHEKEKYQWQAEMGPPIPTSPVNYQPPSMKNSSHMTEIEEFPPPPAETLLPTKDEEKQPPPGATSSLQNQLSASSVVEEQQRWMLEQRDKREKDVQQHGKLSQKGRLKEESEKKECVETALRKVPPKPKPKNYKLKNGTDLSDKPPIHKSSSDEEEAPPRPPPPKNVKSPSYPISPQSMNLRNSNGYADFNRNISQSKPPECVPVPSPPPTKSVYRTPEAAVVNQGVEVPEVLDFKSKMKLFGKFQA